jgi:hypothetical protein
MVAETLDSLGAPGRTLASDDASAPFVGKWNRLVSRTNWEKGHIICLWREALAESGAAAFESSDEAWAMRVGGVSAGHVGRLRRVWQRFGETFEDFEGIYWTHFLVAMDWDDAEMWLEGAASSGWSVSQMRAQRWEALGAPEAEKPTEDDAADGEWDEDSPLLPIGDAMRFVAPKQGLADDIEADHESTSTRERKAPLDASTGDDDAEDRSGGMNASAAAARVRPFADLPELPDDLAEAFEQFKIAILAHRLSGWGDVPCEHVVAALDALKALALAPRDEED